TIRASSGLRSSSSSRIRKKISARLESDVARQTGNASSAASTAADTSSADARSTSCVCSPVAGSKTGPLRPDVPGTSLPPIQWLMRSTSKPLSSVGLRVAKDPRARAGYAPTVRASLQLALFGRVALAAGLGYLIGLERQLRGKAAGDRTFALLAMGAAALVAMAIELFPLSADRVIQGVATGVGFLGAGVIFRR